MGIALIDVGMYRMTLGLIEYLPDPGRRFPRRLSATELAQGHEVRVDDERSIAVFIRDGRVVDCIVRSDFAIGWKVFLAELDPKGPEALLRAEPVVKRFGVIRTHPLLQEGEGEASAFALLLFLAASLAMLGGVDLLFGGRVNPNAVVALGVGAIGSAATVGALSRIHKAAAALERPPATGGGQHGA
jgi:hypothetical protein